MKLLFKIAINAFTLLVVEYIVPGFILSNVWSAVVAAIAIGVVNTFIKPVLQLVALPISIMTLGIFALFVNVALLYGVSFIVPGFHISSFWTAFVASIVLSLVSWFLHKIASD